MLIESMAVEPRENQLAVENSSGAVVLCNTSQYFCLECHDLVC